MYLTGRNPLKSGQCFLLSARFLSGLYFNVAIPSNRVNVSYYEQNKNKSNGGQ